MKGSSRDADLVGGLVWLEAVALQGSTPKETRQNGVWLRIDSQPDNSIWHEVFVVFLVNKF